MQVSVTLCLIVTLLASVSADAGAAPAAISASCRSAIDSVVTNWRVPAISNDVASWARQEHFNPIVAVGDFDGNGEVDEAVLVETSESVKIAVCFSKQHKVTLKLIERPYCRDYLATSPARSEHYNYDTDATERIQHDSINVGCFERAGATYVYEHGTFRKIVDSD